MTRLPVFIALAALFATACAHAAPSGNLCPTGTKAAVLLQENPAGGYPFGGQPKTGAYGETPLQTWTLDPQATGYYVECYSEKESAAGTTTKKDVPAGNTSCTFDTENGTFTCQ